jgi:hypothetical protein
MLLFAGYVNSQSSPTLKIENDSVLVSIKNQLPEGWIMYFNKTTLIIEKAGPFYGKRVKEYVPDTHPNAAPRLPDSLNRKFIQFGLSVTENKMTEEIRNKQILKNSEISQKINNLFTKYDAEKIFRGKTVFNYTLQFPSIKQEKEYYLEKEQLKRKKIAVPYYHTSIYSYHSFHGAYLNSDFLWTPGKIQEEVLFINELLDRTIIEY